MCGRYDLSESPAAIRARFDVPDVPDFLANPDTRPTQLAPVIRLRRDHAARECALLKWGLVPSWSDDPKIGNRLINARAETVARLPSFRNAYRRRRCLIPVSAFYEWSGPKGQRQKWRIAVEDEALFGLAGLWEWWQEPTGPGGDAVVAGPGDANAAAPATMPAAAAGGRERDPIAGAARRGDDPPADAPRIVQSYTIITCAASPAVAHLHDRMPVIVRRADEAAWFDLAHDPASLLVPYTGALRLVSGAG